MRKPVTLLSSLSLLFAFLSYSCNATDTLTSSYPIKDGETLVSAAEIFELGFFSPGNSHYRYLGIWFKKIPVRKYVWVANRENPLNDSSGVLMIGSDGNLLIQDGTLDVVWTANASSRWNSSTAVLLDTGNFQLTEGDSKNSGKVLWESFEHPSNTFLQNMRVGLNLKTGETRLVTSWKGDDDPAPGNFSFGLNPYNLLQAFIWNGTVPYWRSGHWNGRFFIGVPAMESDSVYLDGVSISGDAQKGTIDFEFSVYNSSMVSIFELNSSGIIQRSDWDGDGENWVTKWWGPSANGCDVYNRCGMFGRCDGLDSATCRCLSGFLPKNPEGWRVGDYSGGCVRRSELGHCAKNDSNEGNPDGFLKMEKIKLPDFANWVVGLDATECGAGCLKNCSCVAHAHVSGIGCFHWGGDLVDIQEFSLGGEDLFIRVAHSELGKKKKPPLIVTVVTISFGIVALLVACTSVFCWVTSKQRGKMRKISGQVLESPATDAPTTNANLVREGVMQEGPELPLFVLSKIAEATNNFSDANKIGEGGFGPVYKGRLTDGQEVAVKRLSKRSGQGLEEFKNEATFISRLQHRNLVRLLGCCIEREEKMLIYEYMPNRSLDSFLFDPKRQAQLDWAKRFQIVEGVARGLLYLHRDSRLRIIHRDLKASNILLDEEMNPKISDFGMAWSSGGNQTLAKTNKVVGTYSYMAPEYAKEGRFSEKSDVFSFGVLLLEIISGRRNSSFYHHEPPLNLLAYAWMLWDEGRATDLTEPSLGSSYSLSEVMRCIHVGLLCVQERAADRPTMSTTVFMLGNEMEVLPTPSAPPFNRDISPSASNLPFIRNICSGNNTSITTVEGR